MPTPTLTLHPLPFEHLEPKRFEDLIRQLIYDFRPWHSLEATGRAGSDDGYDARAWEIVQDGDDGDIPNGDEGDDVEADRKPLRKWMVQCKREKKITPKQLGAYLDSVAPEDLTSLHGFIFAACCDFSKKSRDLFGERCRSAGIAECFLWGRAEVEDMLFQPKNDALLFAYFGISLQIRKRSIKTQLRSRLATKRKARKFLHTEQPVLLRDAEDNEYPYLNVGKVAGEVHPPLMALQSRILIGRQKHKIVMALMGDDDRFLTGAFTYFANVAMKLAG